MRTSEIKNPKWTCPRRVCAYIRRRWVVLSALWFREVDPSSSALTDIAPGVFALIKALGGVLPFCTTRAAIMPGPIYMAGERRRTRGEPRTQGKAIETHAAPRTEARREPATPPCTVGACLRESDEDNRLLPHGQRQSWAATVGTTFITST